MEINTEHIIAYLENRLSAEEKEIFDHLIQDSPELKKEVDDLRFILQRADDLNLQRQIDPTAHWKKVFIRLRKKFGISTKRLLRFSQKTAQNLSRHKNVCRYSPRTSMCESLLPVWKTNTITSLYYADGCPRLTSVPSSKTSSTIRTCL